MNESVFLFSTFSPPPDHFFSGYCFTQADTVIGADGFEAYRNTRRSIIAPGEDGCYVVISPQHGGHLIGTDFKGYKKLFYYSRNGVWGVSNSIVRLAQHLRQNGANLTISYPQLSAWFLRTSLGNQLTSFKTVFEEIELVPSFAALVVGDGTAKLQPRPPELSMGYEEALHTFLSTWLSRIVGLFHDEGLHVSSDLTGGCDSRTILSLFLRAQRETDLPILSRMVFRSNESRPYARDFSVAHALCQKHGLSLNGRGLTPVSLSSNESYDVWRALCLGIYAPIYFPSQKLSPAGILFGGGGGESHRPFYPVMDPGEFFDEHAKKFPKRAYHSAWKEDALAAISALERRASSPAHPLIHHYREFRDRCHVGRTPQYELSAAPLGSRLLYRASDACDREALERNQILFDIMHNLSPGLALIPYDDPSKAPTEENLRSLTDVGPLRVSSGRVFKGPQQTTGGGGTDEGDQLRLLQADLEAAGQVMPEGLLDKEYVNDAKAIVEEAQKRGAFRHAVDGLSAHHVILAGEVARLQR